ncbi:HK97 family phage prohead protease [Clostridium sporogenes]|uniref:HK97 family phage prohead protease n=1 Tax=Clostridium sporogenes TaxID=1509 RepID=UPI0013D488EA|nr:HK97 family phage prohead protease [Clostridium sporogenes]NFG97919.1 HK97 family phage prohead protease [Clostridium sporogenes]NFH30969.1 HK97 family phage prohead protease [Clostridium sporogenes]NFL18550.1 HK97 family phage prohead protease [Clostridium sporogenes]NFN73389.1 HK97 family phage prohead protease [Clostridium sporogenes]NFV23585.1 HK97 family phage prohead protease [Clostridium sporogenes]
MDKQKEIRKIQANTIKTRTENDEYIIEGYINKYNTRSQFMGFFEEVRKGAFDKSLATKEYIPALYNHNSDKILGSTRSGSLKLISDDIGLKFNLRINPKITYANDLYELVKAGDIEGCSFGFYVNDDEWTTLEDGNDLRSIKDLELIEVTITPFPAYLDSSANCRSYEEHKKDSEEHKRNEEELRKIELELIRLELE